MVSGVPQGSVPGPLLLIFMSITYPMLIGSMRAAFKHKV